MTKPLLRLPRHTAYSTPLLEAYFKARLSLHIFTPDEAGARLGLTDAKKVQWNREVLVEVLKEQAKQCQAGSKSSHAIDDLLHDNAFTVCTVLLMAILLKNAESDRRIKTECEPTNTHNTCMNM